MRQYRRPCFTLREGFVPSGVDPAVRAVFREIQAQRATFWDVAERAGLNRNTIYSWRTTRIPSVANLRAVLNVMGLDLKIVPLHTKDSERSSESNNNKEPHYGEEPQELGGR